MSLGTCFVSPHSDDIAMSAFALIKAGVLPRPYHLLTIFGISEYAAPGFLKRSRRKDLTILRLLEDECFARWLGMHFSFFRIPDSLKRHGRAVLESAAELEPGLAVALATRIAKRLVELRVDAVVVPHPDGDIQHLDHRLTRCAVDSAARSLGLRLFYVDDIPYSRITAGVSARLYRAVDLRPFLSLKHRALRLYISQDCGFYHQRVDAIAVLNGMTERLFEAW